MIYNVYFRLFICPRRLATPTLLSFYVINDKIKCKQLFIAQVNMNLNLRKQSAVVITVAAMI